MFILVTGILDFDYAIDNFVEISRLFLVEKRLKPERDLQLAGFG